MHNFSFFYYISLQTKGIRFVEGPYRKSIKHRLSTFWILHLKLNSIWMKERSQTLFMKHEHGMLWGRAQVAHKCTERMTEGRKTWKERRTDTTICLSTWSDRTVKRPRWKRFITLIRFLQHPEHIYGTAALRICMWDSDSYLPARVFHMQSSWSLQMW